MEESDYEPDPSSKDDDSDRPVPDLTEVERDTDASDTDSSAEDEDDPSEKFSDEEDPDNPSDDQINGDNSHQDADGNDSDPSYESGPTDPEYDSGDKGGDESPDDDLEVWGGDIEEVDDNIPMPNDDTSVAQRFQDTWLTEMADADRLMSRNARPTSRASPESTPVPPASTESPASVSLIKDVDFPPEISPAPSEEDKTTTWRRQGAGGKGVVRAD